MKTFFLVTKMAANESLVNSPWQQLYMQGHCFWQFKWQGWKWNCMYTCRFLATGDAQYTIADSYRLGHSTVSNIIHETCKVLWSSLHGTYIWKDPHLMIGKKLLKTLNSCGTSQTVLEPWIENMWCARSLQSQAVCTTITKDGSALFLWHWLMLTTDSLWLMWVHIWKKF